MKWTTVWKRLRRGLVVVLLLLTLLVGIGMVYQTTASTQDRETYAPTGQLFEVNGHAMHLYCIGEGSPTVILEAGVGGNTLLWTYIQPAIAEVTRVCAYDRAGYGWSEANSNERTTLNMAEELHILLAQAGIESPYILAGHSFGGIVIRTYASLYPDEVVGLVFIDAAHPNQFSSDHCLPTCFPVDAVRLVDVFYDMLPTMARIGVVRLLIPTGSLPLPFFAISSDFPNQNALIASLSTNAHSNTVVAEWDAFAQSAEYVNETTNVDNMPIRLLTALNTYHEQPLPGHDADETTQTWVALQNDLMRVSTNSVQMVVDEATHFSLLVHPDHALSVSEVIVNLVEEIR